MLLKGDLLQHRGSYLNWEWCSRAGEKDKMCVSEAAHLLQLISTIILGESLSLSVFMKEDRVSQCSLDWLGMYPDPSPLTSVPRFQTLISLYLVLYQFIS